MPSWPHAPPHCIHTAGIYMVTCGTYLKSHFFRSEENLCLLHDTLLQYAKEANWILHAWAVFSNHYHFVGESSKDSEPLTQWLGSLHRMTAMKVNEHDNVTGRKVTNFKAANYRRPQKSFAHRRKFLYAKMFKLEGTLDESASL